MDRIIKGNYYQNNNTGEIVKVKNFALFEGRPVVIYKGNAIVGFHKTKKRLLIKDNFQFVKEFKDVIFSVKT